MTKYQVDKDKMDDYIKSLDKRRTIVFGIVTLIVISIQTFIGYSIDNDFPFWVLIIATIIISVAFYFGLKLANDKLKQLSSGQYFIDNTLLRFVGADSLTREFKLDEIAVVHRKYSGTLIVKGNGWTKFNYIRPKRTNSYQLGGLDIIFIPTITSNYPDLVDTVKRTTPNAIKL
jgi:hypothetical protein